MKTRHLLLKTSANKTANSEKKNTDMKPQTEITLWLIGFNCLWATMRQNLKTAATAAALLETEQNSGPLCFFVEDVEYMAP